MKLARRELEGLQDRQNLLNAGNGREGLRLQLVFIADDADDRPPFAPADMRPIPQLLNAFQDMVDLLLRGIGPNDDDHGTLRE